VSIDDGIPEHWDADVVEACKQYHQGHLVERPPFLYIAVPAHGVWALTRAVGDSTTQEELYETEDRPPFGMITTETCDISEEASRTPRQPWISVAPVFDLAGRLSQAQMVNLEANRVRYVRLLDPPGLPKGLWVVDFRIEVPVEKSWLPGRVPIEAYRSEQQYSRLARALAGRRERPVLSDDVHKALVRPLRRWIERLSTSRREAVLAGVTEVRVLFAGSPLDPRLRIPARNYRRDADERLPTGNMGREMGGFYRVEWKASAFLFLLIPTRRSTPVPLVCI